MSKTDLISTHGCTHTRLPVPGISKCKYPGAVAQNLGSNLDFSHSTRTSNSNPVSSTLIFYSALQHSTQLPQWSKAPSSLNLDYDSSFLSGLPAVFFAALYSPDNTQHNPFKPCQIISSLCSKPNGFPSQSKNQE